MIITTSSFLSLSLSQSWKTFEGWSVFKGFKSCPGLQGDQDKSDGAERRSVLAKGLDYMQRAANAGERSAMVYLAKAFDTGYNLAKPDDQSIAKALYWYEEIQVCCTCTVWYY